jgi:hypothetical protein
MLNERGTWKATTASVGYGTLDALLFGNTQGAGITALTRFVEFSGMAGKTMLGVMKSTETYLVN